MIFSQKYLFVSAVGRNIFPRQTEKPFCDIFFIYKPVLRLGIQVSVYLLDNGIIPEQGPGYKKRVLKIDLILLVIAVIGKFSVSG